MAQLAQSVCSQAPSCLRAEATEWLPTTSPTTPPSLPAGRDRSRTPTKDTRKVKTKEKREKKATFNVDEGERISTFDAAALHWMAGTIRILKREVDALSSASTASSSLKVSEMEAKIVDISSRIVVLESTSMHNAQHTEKKPEDEDEPMCKPMHAMRHIDLPRPNVEVQSLTEKLEDRVSKLERQLQDVATVGEFEQLLLKVLSPITGKIERFDATEVRLTKLERSFSSTISNLVDRLKNAEGTLARSANESICHHRSNRLQAKSAELERHIHELTKRLAPDLLEESEPSEGDTRDDE